MRILIAEDDPVLADGLTRSLRSGEYAVDCVTDGVAADHALSTQTYDLVILDLGLPRIDGFEVIKRLRRRSPTPPVLVLTARDALQDRVRGLDLGADDYLTKPFELPELEARVRALIRRGMAGGNSLILNGKLNLDITGHRVTVDDQPLDLSARELGVLEVLMMRSGRVVSKDQLAEKLYGWDEDVGANAIEVCVHRLRKKIEPSGVVIRTIRGLGYLMEKDAPMMQGVTLRRQVLAWVSIPLGILWAIGVSIDYDIAKRYVNVAYDRALLESALDIGRQVRVLRGRIYVDLPEVAIQMLRTRETGQLYYMVTGPDREFITGEADIKPAPPSQSGQAHYYDDTYRNQPVRVAAIQLPVETEDIRGQVTVYVLETRRARTDLIRELSIGFALPQALVALLAFIVIWFSVTRALAPLALLRQEIEQRSHRDLSPLPATRVPAEVRPLVESMNALLNRLSAALSSQQRFIADAAHQLRTPIAGLRTQTELALRQSDPHETRVTLKQIQTAADHTTHLVNQLLSLARAEPSAEQTQAMVRLDILALARATTTEWVPRALPHGIDLGFEEISATGAPIHAIHVNGDDFLLREMLGNLIDNAIRYTQRGGHVTVKLGTAPPDIHLSVEDNGPGIPESERDAVLERFHRVLGTGVDGCGLGLSIVREIVLRHGGTIKLLAGAGNQGTLALVTLPIAV